MNDIYLQAGIIQNITNLDEVKRVFSDFASVDNDLTGENGKEYLWETAKKQGFETNLDYLLTDVFQQEKIFANKDGYSQGFYYAVKEFFDRWLGYDNYYKDYNFCIEPIENNRFSVAISFAYTVN